MHAPDGSCRKPAGARAPVTGGTDGEGARAPRPTAGVAAARPQADPAVGGGACPKGALEPAPWRGATQPGRRGPSSGARSQDASLLCGRDGARRGRGRGAAARTMATARPIHRRRPPRGRRIAGWVGTIALRARAGRIGAHAGRTRGPRAAAYLGRDEERIKRRPPAEFCEAKLFAKNFFCEMMPIQHECICASRAPLSRHYGASFSKSHF